MNTVEVRDLSKSYIQGGERTVVLDGVSFSVSSGEVVAITGQSGSGKTTLLDLIGGIGRPDLGSVYVDGADIYEAGERELAAIRRRRIGRIFQDFNLIPILTAEENIIMPVLLDSKKVDRERLMGLARFLGIEDRLGHLPSELSGGQRQRVAIARALINGPGVLLADEPTGSLERGMADEIVELLFDLAGRGVTVLLVTHEERYAKKCPRRLTLSRGRICED